MWPRIAWPSTGRLFPSTCFFHLKRRWFARENLTRDKEERVHRSKFRIGSLAELVVTEIPMNNLWEPARTRRDGRAQFSKERQKFSILLSSSTSIYRSRWFTAYITCVGIRGANYGEKKRKEKVGKFYFSLPVVVAAAACFSRWC